MSIGHKILKLKEIRKKEIRKGENKIKTCLKVIEIGISLVIVVHISHD